MSLEANATYGAEGWDKTFDQTEDILDELEDIPKLKFYVFLARIGHQIAEFFVQLYYRMKWQRLEDSSSQSDQPS